MKATVPTLTLCGMALVLVSCAAFDPEYADYKKQQKEQQSAPSPYGSTPDPYGAGGTNPYGVPSGGTTSTEVGSYTPSGAPGYQPLPGVPSDPIPPTRVTPGTSYPSYPSIGSPTPAAAVSHTVAKGDSLWGLAQRNNTTVEAIKQANGLTSDTIRVGQTLRIPK